MGKRKVQPVDSDDEVALEPSDVEVEVGVDTPELIPCLQSADWCPAWLFCSQIQLCDGRGPTVTVYGS